MIRSIEIKGLRGIREGRLDDLTPLVVLVGPNGCGKSTLLEAMLIGASQYPEKAVGYVATRRAGIKQGYEWMLTGETSDRRSNSSFIRVTTDADCERSVRFALSEPFSSSQSTYTGHLEEKCGGEVTANTALGVRFDNGLPNQLDYWGRRLNGVEDIRILESEAGAGGKALHTLYTQAVKDGRREEVIRLMREVVPNLSHLEILTEKDAPIIHLVYNDHSIPVALGGSGTYTLLRLALELTAYSGRVALLEEPEVYKHPGAIRQSARVIWAAIRRDIQVIISTHSLELIDMLLVEVQNQKELDKLSVYGLMLKDGCLRSSHLNGSDVAFSRTQIEDDLR